jgi:hypothetical protein
LSQSTTASSAFGRKRLPLKRPADCMRRC